MWSWGQQGWLHVEDYGSISPLSRNAEILLFLYMCTECTGPTVVQMFRTPLAEGATDVAAGGGRNPGGALQAQEEQIISLPRFFLCSPNRVVSGSSVISGLGGGFLTLSHSTNRRVGLSMHLGYLVLTVFLGQLLGKSCLFINAYFFSSSSENSHQPYQVHAWKFS